MVPLFALLTISASPQQSNSSTQTIKIGDRLIRFAIEGYMSATGIAGIDPVAGLSISSMQPSYLIDTKYYTSTSEGGSTIRLSGGGGVNIAFHPIKNLGATGLRTGIRYVGDGGDVAIAQTQASNGQYVTNDSDQVGMLRIQSVSIPLLIDVGFNVGKSKRVRLGVEFGTIWNKPISAKLVPTDLAYATSIERKQNVLKDVSDWYGGQWVVGAFFGGNDWCFFLNYQLPKSGDGVHNVFKKDSVSSIDGWVGGIRVFL